MSISLLPPPPPGITIPVPAATAVVVTTSALAATGPAVRLQEPLQGGEDPAPCPFLFPAPPALSCLALPSRRPALVRVAPMLLVELTVLLSLCGIAVVFLGCGFCCRGVDRCFRGRSGHARTAAIVNGNVSLAEDCEKTLMFPASQGPLFLQRRSARVPSTGEGIGAWHREKDEDTAERTRETEREPVNHMEDVLAPDRPTENKHRPSTHSPLSAYSELNLWNLKPCLRKHEHQRNLWGHC